MKRIRTLGKYTLIVSFTMLVITIIGTLATIYLVPRDQIVRLIMTRLEEKLDRRIEFESAYLGLQGLEIQKIVIFDSRDADEKNILLSAESLNLDFSVFSLLDNNLVLQKISLTSPVLELSWNNEHWNFEEIIERLRPAKNGNSEPADDGFTVSLSTVRISDAKISLVSSPPDLAILTGQYTLSLEVDLKDNIYSINKFRIELPHQRGSASGEGSLTKGPDQVLSGDFELHNLDLDWIYAWRKTPIQPYQSLSGKVSVKKASRSHVILEGQVKGRIRGGPKYEAGGLVTIVPGESLALSNVSLAAGSSSADIKSLERNLKTGAISVILNNIDVQLAELALVQPSKLPAGLYGRVRGNLSKIGQLTNANLELTNVGLDPVNGLVAGIQGNLVIKNNIFRMENTPFLFKGQPGVISITSTDPAMQDIVANIYFKDFDLSESGKSGGAPLPASGSTNSGSVIRGRIEIGKLKLHNYTVQNAVVDYVFLRNQKRVDLTRVSSEFLGAALVGNGTIDLNRQIPSISMALRFQNFRIQRLAEIKPEFKNRFFGLADGSLKLEVPIGDKRPLLDSLQGSVSFIVRQGKLANTGIQNGLGIFLEPLRYKLQDLEFSSINGDIDIAQSRFNITSFHFMSPDIRIHLSGFLYPDRRGNIDIDLEFNNEFIKDIPNPAYPQFARFRQGSWFRIPFRSEGDDVTRSNSIKRRE